MAYRGIFLDKIHPNVKAKLTNLHKEAGDIHRSSRAIERRTPWIRLTSNAASTEPGFPVANHYILHPSVIDTTPDPVDPPRHGQLEGWGPGDAFGKLYAGNRRNLPRPAIESISVSNKGPLGSVRSATIKGMIYSEKDLDWFEKLYMMPGITLLLEWGWSTFPGNHVKINASMKPKEVHEQILQKTLMSNDFWKIKEGPKATGGSIDDVGSYDGMLGVITSFNWTNNTSGYSFDIKILSPNSIMNSMALSTNIYGASIVSTTTISETEHEQSLSSTNKTINITPLDDIEAVLSHLSYMGTGFKSTGTIESFAKDEDGDPVLVSTATATTEKEGETATPVASGSTGQNIDMIKKTNVESLMNFLGNWNQPYTFSESEIDHSQSGDAVTPFFAKGKDGKIQAFQARVYHDVPFSPTPFSGDETWKDYRTDETFIRWTFFEKLISNTMPISGDGKPIVTIDSSSPNEDGKFRSNRLFSHDNLFSANHNVCIIRGRMGPIEAGFPMTSGMFNNTLPDFEGKENFTNFDKMVYGKSTLNANVKDFEIEKGVGSLDGIWVNANFLLKTYRRNKTSFNKLIMSCLDGINNACGRPWDFQIQNNSNDPTKISIVDLNSTPNSKHLFGDTGLTYKFKTAMGILRNVTLTSKLPKGIQAMAYIAAASANPGEFEGSDTFSLYQSGKADIYDRLTRGPNKKKTIQEEKEEQEELEQQEELEKHFAATTFTQTTTRPDKEGFTNSPEYDMKLSAYKSIIYGIDTYSAENKLKDYTQKIVFQNTKDNDIVPLIPIEASFTIDGLAGIYQGNGWELDTVDEGGILPNRYKNKVAFQTVDVSHTVGLQGWETTIRGMMRVVEKKKRHYKNVPPPAISIRSAVNATPGKNGPPSNKSPDALNPIVKSAWLKVETELIALGWQPQIVTAFRSLEYQAKKKEQGRSQVTMGSHTVIDAQGNRASQALDIIDKRYSYGNSKSSIAAIGKQATKDKAFLFWGAMGRIGKEQGFTWGGDYSWKGNPYLKDGTKTTLAGKRATHIGWDPGHLEMMGGTVPSVREYLAIMTKALGRTITSKGNNIV